MHLSDIPARSMPLQPWKDGEKIPWNDPDFSRRMLVEHLSQEHDAASRRSERIDLHVDWIFNCLLCSRPARVLDLGCGPGLYSSRLARLGCECEGIDFSPASIEYARRQADSEQLNCHYQQADLRAADFGADWDLVMFLYGEFNVFTPADARLLLSKARQVLRVGGMLLLELSTYESVRQIGSRLPTWYSADHGLFSDLPHIVLIENHWDASQAATVEQFFVIDAGSGAVERIAATTQAYTLEGIIDLLEVSGFEDVHVHPSLGETLDPAQADFFVLTATV